MPEYDIYKTEGKHPKTYLVFKRYSENRWKIAKRYFHASFLNLEYRVCWIYKGGLYFEKPNNRAKLTTAYFYKKMKQGG